MNRILLLVLLATGALQGDAPLPWLTPPPLTNTPSLAPDTAPKEIGGSTHLDSRNPDPGSSVESAATNSEAAASPPAAELPRPFPFIDPAGQPGQLRAHLLVVYNAKDPESRSLALYYAARRHIPAERILALTCAETEEITRTQFDETIRQPILDDLLQHHWLERQATTTLLRGERLDLLAATRNDIWAMVLMRGVPLKIASTSAAQTSIQTEPQLSTNAAAVDSELATLPVFGLPLGGFVPNPFFDVLNSGEVRVGPELARHLILVTRLDGPTAGVVRRMIDDGLFAETNRLAGEAVIDSRGYTDAKNGFTIGDNWLRQARDLLAADGWCVDFDDNPGTLPATDPVNQVALYLGWYATDANGPWIVPPNRFVRGAIAYHLHSFSASTVRSTTSNWVGPLLDHGAAATMGTVYEPYLVLTPHLEIFTRRLLDGDSFAEAAYACQPGLSWMTTVVGDPLYHPFQRLLPEALAAAPPGDHRDWLLLQQVQRRWTGPSFADADNLPNAPGLARGGARVLERLGDLLQKINEPHAQQEAEKDYEKAQQLSVQPIDAIRIGLKLAGFYQLHHQDSRAQNVLSSLRQNYPINAPRFGAASVTPATGSSGVPAGERTHVP